MLIPARESCAAEDELRADVEQVACPVVLIDRLVQNGWCDAVGFDNYVGGRLAARYLLEGGHRHIGIVTGDVAESSALDRKRGFVDAIEQAGERFDPALCVAGDYRFDSGYHAADRIIDGGATAVFCCNDVMALGFRQRLAERYRVFQRHTGTLRHILRHRVRGIPHQRDAVGSPFFYRLAVGGGPAPP